MPACALGWTVLTFLLDTLRTIDMPTIAHCEVSMSENLPEKYNPFLEQIGSREPDP